MQRASISPQSCSMYWLCILFPPQEPNHETNPQQFHQIQVPTMTPSLQVRLLQRGDITEAKRLTCDIKQLHQGPSSLWWKWWCPCTRAFYINKYFKCEGGESVGYDEVHSYFLKLKFLQENTTVFMENDTNKQQYLNVYLCMTINYSTN